MTKLLYLKRSLEYELVFGDIYTKSVNLYGKKIKYKVYLTVFKVLLMLNPISNVVVSKVMSFRNRN